MQDIFYSPFFGVFISVFAFKIGLMVQQRLKNPLANPLLVAVLLIILFLKITGIPLAAFQTGGDLIALFLAPATAALAVPIYKNFQLLKAHWFPICTGALVGSLSSMTIIFLLGRWFGLDQALANGLIAKSVTTPIAMEVTKQLNGLVPIAIAAVIFTGILGSMIAPFLAKIFNVTDPLTQGVAIGTCSHAVGTTRAIQMGEIQGAMSGVAMGLSGLFTVFLAYLFIPFC